MIGFFIWCWNDVEWLETSLPTFRDTTENVFFYGISNAASDSSLHLLAEYCDYTTLFTESQSMSACVNRGYQELYDRGCDYLGWIHPDQKFEQKGWEVLLRNTLDTYPEIGKISCENVSHPSGLNVIYPGAEAGNLIRREHWNSIGPYDENFIGCGGYEDWDIQRRFIASGLGCCINPHAKVWHRHAGTREKIDHGLRHEMWLQNQSHYYNKWNTYDNAMVPDGWSDLPLITT